VDGSSGVLSEKSIRWMQWAVCAICAAAFVFCIVKTLHWQVVWDQSVIRYARFLISRGMRPYSDITDMNMPGCYLMEAWGMAIFGWGDLGWRIYEYCLIAGIAAAGMLLGGRRYWMTGVYAATLFLLARFADGEGFSLERNEIMGLLDVLGLVLFVLGLQRKKPVAVGVSSALICLTATMKPGGVLLEILLLGLLVWTCRRQGISSRPYLAWAAVGAAAGFLPAIVFLVHEHAVKGLLFIVLKVWPVFRTMSPHEPLTITLVPKLVLPLAGLAVLAAFRNRAAMGWQRAAFVLGLIYGGISYKLEGGEARYHRYVFLAVLVMWIGWELTLALRSEDKPLRWMGVLGLMAMAGYVVPSYLVVVKGMAHHNPELEAYPAALEADLNQLGGQRLQGRVECLEMVDGCLRALYEMRLVQNTGSTGDMLLFTHQDTTASRYYRDWYEQRQQKHPADVVVLGNFFFESPLRSFDRIDTWPEYAATLRSDYALAVERTFGGGSNPEAYRVYVRKGAGIPFEQLAPKR
jgi:hypothetical protein